MLQVTLNTTLRDEIASGYVVYEYITYPLECELRNSFPTWWSLPGCRRPSSIALHSDSPESAASLGMQAARSTCFAGLQRHCANYGDTVACMPTGISVSPQLIAYDACQQRYGSRHRYLAMIDADEVCGTHDNLTAPHRCNACHSAWTALR